MLLSINIVHMVSAFTSVFLFFPALVGEPSVFKVTHGCS